jgi:hypothetical protein
MTHVDPHAAQPNGSEPDAGSREKPRKGDYAVGRGRPPVQSRFKPGQSGNPKGRRAERPNIQAMIKDVMYFPVPVRRGEKTELMPLYQAVLYALGVKAVKGDARSASVYLAQTNQHCEAFNSEQPSSNFGLSDKIFEGVAAELLSADDKIELARIAGLIDLGGDMTAVKASDFERLQQILNKGRGKDITPSERPSPNSSTT